MGGPQTITVTSVKIAPGDQPAALSYQGDQGKPYFPCKSMRRVLVYAWGPDANAYAGRSMTLYRDPNVTFGALKVGGIRISHLSHIDTKLTMALTATKGAKKAYQVDVLKVTQARMTTGVYVRQKLDECQSRDAVADLAGNDQVFREHGEKESVRALVAARLSSFPEEVPTRVLEPVGADLDDEIPL